MNLEVALQEAIRQAFVHLYQHSLPESEPVLQPTRKDFPGSHTLVTFPYGKALRQSPPEIARAVGGYLTANTALVTDFNVVQGFLNLTVADQTWLDLFHELLADPHFGTFPARAQTVMVEFSSPNTNKPLHLGHLRNNFLGYSVSEILKANGYRVVRANLVNDRGIHICKSMLAYQKSGHGETPDAGTKGDHLVGKYYVAFEEMLKAQTTLLLENNREFAGLPDLPRREIAERRNKIAILQSLPAGDAGKIKEIEGEINEIARSQTPIMKEAQQMLVNWERGDPATRDLWQRMNAWVDAGFEQTYRTMGVSFDRMYSESGTYQLGKEVVAEGLQKGVFFAKPDGSVWIDLSAEGLDEKLVLRADGTSVYITQDLGTADLKYRDFGVDRSLYVVGNEQDYHFAVLFAILKRLGRPYADGLYHLSYGMVDLPSGKMKSREGTVVDADELMQEMVETAGVRPKELGKIEDFDGEDARQLYRVVGLGALKYFLLKVDPKKRMLFNPEESIDFQGHTGPFIQFNYARISSVLRKAGQMGIEVNAALFQSLATLHPTERDLIGLLSEYPARVKEAGEAYAPSVIAQYVYEVAKAYGRLWTEVSILGEPEEAIRSLRVALSHLTARTIRQGMGLLGIEVPERM